MEAQPPSVDGITAEQKTARLNMVNMSGDMTRYGRDTPKLIQKIRDQMDGTDIELEYLSLTSLPNFGKDLGFRSVIIAEIDDLEETTQTNLRDFLLAGAVPLKQLNIGDIAFLSIIPFNNAKLTINFIGPIVNEIHIDNFGLQGPEITLAAPKITLVQGTSLERIRIGPGCKHLLLIDIEGLKTIDIDDPSTLETVRFEALPNLEHYTPLPHTAVRSGDFFVSDAIPEITIPFTNQQVYDFEENEEVPMITILSRMGSIIFKAKESYFTLPLEQVEKSHSDGSQIRYKCNGELHGAPVEGEVDMETPYYYVQGNGNFIVPLHELTSALLKYKIIELVQTDIVLDYVASAKAIIMSPTDPVNRYGEDVNIVSADHCQAGTNQRVFTIKGVILTGETGGRSRAKRTVSKKRRTYKKNRNYKGPYINPAYNTVPFKR